MKNVVVYFQKISGVIVLSVIFALALTTHMRAATPGIINYQGRVQSGGTDFNGSGQFKFALVDSTGTTTYWSNDGNTPPTLPVSVTVTKGLYSVLLGDTTITNMTSIPSNVFGNSDVRLRIWFNDGTNGPQLLTPDQRVAATGYAMRAAVVDDNTITTAKITALPKCRAFYDIGNQIFTGSSGLQFNKTLYDTDNIHPAPGTRLTCNTAGIYHIFGNVLINCSSGTGYNQLFITKNGTTNVAIIAIPTLANGNDILAISTDVELMVGDYVELVPGTAGAGTASVLPSSASEQWRCEFGMHYIP